MTDAKPTPNPSQIRSSTITPPPELVREWREEPAFSALSPCSIVSLTTTKLQDIATRAAQWGADQELDACCEWLAEDHPYVSDDLRTARRPKPPSLAEEALEALLHLLDGAAHSMDTTEPAEYIRRALERLQQLENNQ